MKKHLILIFIFFCFFSRQQVYAQNFNLAIYPTIIRIDSLPDSTILQPITIENLADNDINLKIIFRPFSASSADNGQLQYEPENTSSESFLKKHVYLLAQNKKISEFTLGALKHKKLQLSVNIPSDQQSLDYYFSVLFIGQNGPNSSQSIVGQAGGIGMNVILSIGQKGITTGKIDDFSTPSFLNYGPVQFSLLLENTSSHYIEPTGSIKISDMFGQNIGKVELLPQTILSNSSRYLVDNRQNSLKNNTISGTHGFAIWPQKYLFGFYTASLTISLSQGTPPLEKTVHFLAVPIFPLTLLLLGLIVLIGIYLRVRKRRIK